MGKRTTNSRKLNSNSDAPKKLRHSDLVRIEKHPHYYVNPVSKKIYYRRTHKGVTDKIASGETAIGKAKEVVEQELERRRTGKSEKQVKRERRGVKSPMIETVWFEDLLPERLVGKAEATKKSYAKNWKHGIGPFWGNLTVLDMNDKNLAAYRKWYLEEHPTRLPKKTLDQFQVLAKFLFKRKYIREMPDLSILADMIEITDKNSMRKPVGRVFTDGEVKALLGAHAKIPKPLKSGEIPESQRRLEMRAKLGIRLGLRGLRIMEAMSSRRERVHFEKKVMDVWSQKNSKWREVPIDDELIECFKEQYRLNPNSPWVFPMPSNPARHISAQNFDKVWYRARKYAGIIPRWRLDARFHDLRHTFATWTAEQGWPPRVACAVLDMTLRVYESVYSKPRLDSKASWMAKTFPGTREDKV